MRWESWMDSPLFAGMGRDALCSLLRRLPWTRRHYARGDTVCEVGAGVEALGLVAAGSVYIESCDAWGERSLLGAVEAGQIFAEAYACLPGEPLMVRVVAAGDAEVIFLKAEALLREPPLARNLVELLARKNLQLSRRMRCTAPRTIRRRLMVYLVRGGGAAGQPELCHSLQPAGAGGLPGGGPQRAVHGDQQNAPGGLVARPGKQLCAHRAGGVIFPHAPGAFAAY